VPNRWTRTLALALDDFFGDLLDELRDALAHERAAASSPRRKAGRSPRPVAEREARERAATIARAWRTLERIAGTSPVHPTAENARQLVRKARYRSHPDRKPGKKSRDFLRVQHAAEILSSHYGVTL
jgi:hypothetical protein